VNDEFQYGDRCGVIFSPYIIGPITALHSPAAAFCGLYQGGWVGYNTRAEIDLGHKVIDNTVTKKLVGDHDCDKQPNRVLWRVRRGNQLVLALTIVKQLVSHHYSLQLQCDSINVVRQLWHTIGIVNCGFVGIELSSNSMITLWLLDLTVSYGTPTLL